MILFGGILAFLWGLLWSLFLHFNALGQALRRQMAWLPTAVGSGVNLMILLYMAGGSLNANVTWWWLPVVFFFSAIPVAALALWEMLIRDAGSTLAAARNVHEPTSFSEASNAR
jgi:hypothetical protein